MWFFASNHEVELSNTEFYFPTEFEYDGTKIEIKKSDKENHFILKVLRPCDKERIVSILKPATTILGKNGELIKIPSPYKITITISTEGQGNNSTVDTIGTACFDNREVLK